MKSVTACKDSLNSRTLNANAVCATCNKCLADSNHFTCVTKMLNDVHARTKNPNVVPISTRKPKSQANKLIETPNKKKVASKSTNQKPQSYFRVLYENTNKFVQLILFIVDSGCTKHMTGNLKLLCNFVEKFLGTVRFGNDQFASILGYGDLVQGNVMINRVYYVESLNHNLFSVGQFCNADLEVTPTQAWLWHQRLSHLNFDYINLLAKKDIVIGLPKLKYVKDQLCSSCELSKAKRSSFKSKAIPSSKGRLNLLHMDLCGPMQVASINGKKYILVIVDDYSRYTGTEFLNKTLNAFFQEEGIELQTSTARTPEQNGVVERRNHTLSKGYHVYSKRIRMIVESIYIRFDEIKEVKETYVAINTSGLVPQRQKASDCSNLQDEQPSTNIPSTSAPLTHTNLHAEENKNDQAEEREQLQDDEFTNPFCALTQKVAESSSHNLGSLNIPACCDDDDDYNSAITPNEPVDSVSMGDEHLDTISATKSNEFIKSCVENLVPNPSEPEVENGCDVPACFTNFSNILFDADYKFDYIDDQSCSDEDVLEKIFSNPLFNEEIISIKIDPHQFNAESNFIESMLNHDSSIISSSSKINSLLDEFADELTFLKSIPSGLMELIVILRMTFVLSRDLLAVKLVKCWSFNVLEPCISFGI
nr:hypothetical protein [Tanacetum cinerariifolium]GEY79866.1 hypothetical protein [Tanacetum cinerariifolium]